MSSFANSINLTSPNTSKQFHNSAFVRGSILGNHVYVAGGINGWFFRQIATSGFSLMQKFSRCERMQQEVNSSGLGSSVAFAALYTNGRFCLP